MLNLLVIIDLEVKYQRWLRADAAARRLDAQSPEDMRRLFTYIWRAYPTSLVFEFEVERNEMMVEA